LASAIKQFGVKAVLGRDVLACGEIMRMNYCENVRSAYQGRARAEDWAKWTNENPALARVLNEAEIIANASS